MAGARVAVAIASSAGGVAALPRLLRSLDTGVDAAIFVVQHLSPLHRSDLSLILGHATSLPCSDARHGAAFESGHVYVAPPDRHLLVDGSRMYLSRTIKVCHVRPSADVLFRSVAQSFAHRAIGIVLTGRLRDGTAGLATIKRAGGIAIVQDPAEALAPGMPQSALDNVDVDYCVSLQQMGPLLCRVSGRLTPAAAWPHAAASTRTITSTPISAPTWRRRRSVVRAGVRPCPSSP